MNKLIAFVFSFLGLALPIMSASYDFEKELPLSFSVVGEATLKKSSLHFKDGANSLEWSWEDKSSLIVSDAEAFSVSVKASNNGVLLWIYNEIPKSKPLQFEFQTGKGLPVYSFAFNLDYKGWRACWMKYEDMNLLTSDKSKVAQITQLVITPDQSLKKGKLFIDRFSITSKRVNAQVTPDAQLPENNRSLIRTLWHWCRLWEWEQLKYDIPLSAIPVEITPELDNLQDRLDKLVVGRVRNEESLLKRSNNLYKKFNLRKEKGVIKGNPLVVNDELNKKADEMSLSDFNNMLYGFAVDAFLHDAPESKQRFFDVFNYGLDQGFAFGSSMGSNHHYGYQIRDLFDACWMMRASLPKNKEIHRAIVYWSGLQETRMPYATGRDELLDSWNTLLIPRFIAAMLYESKEEQFRALNGLSRWLSGSMAFTPGTIGGIKSDGTVFHHGGFYPAYSVGAIGAIGNYLQLTQGTSFEINPEAKAHLKLVLQQMRNYTSLREWPIGICGRHPFKGELTLPVVNTFAYLASTEHDIEDLDLASGFMFFKDGDNAKKKQFVKAGIQAAQAPEGFFSYNYAAFGVHRRDNWMVSMKGFNSNVWSSEIYQKDNRYGRYQSYGAVEIFNATIGDRKANGFVEEGWDWNRLPGTTTIHLPLEKLESPRKGTLMVRSDETFAGVSSFEGKNGMFAIDLQESDYPNFTSDFRAKKSVFCFDNRIVCLGSNISNSNKNYKTETTLFQNWLGLSLTDNPVKVERLLNGSLLCNDNNGNYYYLDPSQELKVEARLQDSKQNKSRKNTTGYFVSAWLNHGEAPQQVGYEYMIFVAPSKNMLQSLSQKPYEVLCKDEVAHIVYDKTTGITGAAFFEAYQETTPQTAIYSASDKTFVMYRQTASNELHVSVCFPDLNITGKAYTTAQPSRSQTKTVCFYGNYRLKENNALIKCIPNGQMTQVTVSCQEGQTIEFILNY